MNPKDGTRNMYPNFAAGRRLLFLPRNPLRMPDRRTEFKQIWSCGSADLKKML